MPRASIPLPDQDYLHQCFQICFRDVTRPLLWKVRPFNHYSSLHGWKIFNTLFANKRAGMVCPSGLVKIRMHDESYCLPRILFKLVHNLEPVQVIHRDGNRLNNHIRNLIAGDGGGPRPAKPARPRMPRQDA